MNANLPVGLAATLEPDFQPAILFKRACLAAAEKSGRAVPLIIGLERKNRRTSRYETIVLPEADASTLRHVASFFRVTPEV